MLVIVVAEIAVVGCFFLFFMTVPMSMRADAPVTVAMARLVQGEGHAEHGKDKRDKLLLSRMVALLHVISSSYNGNTATDNFAMQKNVAMQFLLYHLKFAE